MMDVTTCQACDSLRADLAAAQVDALMVAALESTRDLLAAENGRQHEALIAAKQELADALKENAALHDCHDLMLAANARADARQRRYNWLTNTVLACDYGDNDNPGHVGWRVMWHSQPIAYGRSIDAAIDAAMAAREEK